MSDALHVRIAGPVATLTLTRPDLHNAVDAQLAATLTQAFQKIGVADLVRVVVLAAEGPSFCGGIELGWLQAGADHTAADLQRDAAQLAMLVDAVDRCPKPVIALVQGPAIGLGVGLVAAADMAISVEEASFALPEIRVGLSPSVVAPVMAAAIGARACRRYMLSGERFDAREALRLGLIHGVVAANRLEAARDHLVDACLKGGPAAQAAVKDLIRVIDDSPMGPDLLRYTATHFAESRLSDEGRDGVAALAEKRPPSWSS
ncbi:enoyl-CoA hydratase [Paramagnetospirillum marisnigri]|uniref:Enoyl-CoA hydratase n=1 Tax=Paramagnetospirillum marisnigri TaxID=1285242 RepID=A0A178MH61_9PROT|nr:enoyl-CoA hydratase-related protein [Paramagnetospirillum marisnigri]OAN47996.1 enoyl-CoA hydratase [Paramagnetospirillum marisnigri]